MADEKLTALTETTDVASSDILYVVKDPSTVPISRKITKTNFIGEKKVRGFVSNPQAVYSQRAQVVIAETTAAITITKITIKGNDSTPTSELAGDLKFADDQFDGSFANATVIDVCDTTNGSFVATSSFDDATVPSGKFIYFQFDASPHADWKTIFIQIHYTVD